MGNKWKKTLSLLNTRHQLGHKVSHIIHTVKALQINLTFTCHRCGFVTVT